MKKLAIENKKTRKRHKALLKRLSLGAIALLVFASSTLQARAYYEKDPDLEYLRTSKYFVRVIDKAYKTSNVRLLAEITTNGLNGSDDAMVDKYSTKSLSLITSRITWPIDSFSVYYQTDLEDKVVWASPSLTIANLRQEKEADGRAAEIAIDIRKRSSDPRERIELVNKYLIDHVDYPKIIDEDNPLLWSAYGALVEGSAVCEGYARAFNKILRILDIPVINVVGIAYGGDHMWNQVLLDGQWLHVDVTHNDTGGSHIKYFLLTDKEIQRISPRKEDLDTSKEEAQEVFYGNRLDHLAEILEEKGIFLSDERGFRLDDSLTRAEMAVIVARLVGGLDEIEEYKEYYQLLGKGAFVDVPDWAAPYIAYCYKHRLILGVAKKRFGPSQLVNKLDYSTVLLKASGIHRGYTYETSDVEAVKRGFLSKTRAAFPDLSRGDMVHMTYNFLTK